jgi:hypothetical protein
MADPPRPGRLRRLRLDGRQTCGATDTLSTAFMRAILEAGSTGRGVEVRRYSWSCCIAVLLLWPSTGPCSPNTSAACDSVDGRPALDAMEPPFVIERPSEYADGGTLTGILVDAHGRRLSFCFDMRMCRSDDSQCRHPRKVFLGAHPTCPGARPLSLWGGDERKLVAMLRRATFLQAASPHAPPTDDSARALAIEVSASGSIENANRLKLSAAIESRFLTDLAIERGEVAAPETALRFAGMTPTLRLSTVTSAPEYFEYSVLDSLGTEVRLRMARAPLAPSASLVSGEWQYSGEGTQFDRMWLALTKAALADEVKATAPLPTGGVEQALLEVVRNRMKRIITADRRR